MTKRKKGAQAYLTLYLAMTLGVMVPLCLAMIESVRVNTLETEVLLAADASADGVMAEYHRELFRRYNLLALDSSYGTKTVGRTNVEGRLAWYLDENMKLERQASLEGLSKLLYKDFLQERLNYAQITEFMLLSDWDGAAFRREAVEALKDDLGVVMLRDTLGWMKTVEEYQLDVRDVEAEKRAVDEQIASYQGRETEDGKELQFDNPTTRIESAKKTGILWQVLGDGSVSGKVMDQSQLIFQRAREKRTNHGNMELPAQSVMQKTGEKLMFEEYLLSYFGHYLDPKEDCALDYEIEYVIAGKNGDAANLRGVLRRLLAIREAANATYLFSDKTKCSEAETVAAALSMLLGVPELKDPFKVTILLGWAYVESIYDLKVLMKGGRVPLMKDSGSWHYGFTGILEGLWETAADKGGEGLSYEDYLRILLTLTEEGEMTGRVMNLVEANMRLTPGNQYFRLDGCYLRMRVRVSVSSGRGYLAEADVDKKY